MTSTISGSSSGVALWVTGTDLTGVGSINGLASAEAGSGKDVASTEVGSINGMASTEAGSGKGMASTKVEGKSTLGTKRKGGAAREERFSFRVVSIRLGLVVVEGARLMLNSLPSDVVNVKTKPCGSSWGITDCNVVAVSASRTGVRDLVEVRVVIALELGSGLTGSSGGSVETDTVVRSNVAT
jgi:hypothetical protein